MTWQMPCAHSLVDSKSQLLVSVPQLLLWLCSHVFPLQCLDPCSRSGARKVVALLTPWWQTVPGACLAGVCLLLRLGIGWPGRLTLPTNTELDEAICRA